jgi:hypothetical protein
MALEIRRFDIQDYITSDQAQTGYLEAALEDGDCALMAAAIGDIARARRFGLRSGIVPQPGDGPEPVPSRRQSNIGNDVKGNQGSGLPVGAGAGRVKTPPSSASQTCCAVPDKSPKIVSAERC